MVTEQWIIWNVVPEEKDIYLLSIVDRIKTLEIFLSTNSCKVKLIFDQDLFFYKVTDEWCTLERIRTVTLEQGQDLLVKSCFFQVIHSPLMQELRTDDYMVNFIVSNQYKHYVIFDGNSLVDIISSKEPAITKIGPAC